jgi:hypothetical protein
VLSMLLVSLELGVDSLLRRIFVRLGLLDSVSVSLSDLIVIGVIL